LIAASLAPMVWRRHRARRTDRDRSGWRASGSLECLRTPGRRRLCLCEWTANRAAKLLAAKILEGFAVGCMRRQSLQSLKEEETTMHCIGTRLGNNVDDAARRAPDSAVAPVATTWNSFTASSGISIAAR